jgi:riboflavin kinase / FMN adenylyltransferase
LQVWRDPEAVNPSLGASVVTVGVFDGVHRGHRAVVAEVVRRARERGVAAVVVTFDPHPMAVVRPDAAPSSLAPLDLREELLTSLGVDGVLVLGFTPEVSRWSPEEFVERVLVGALHAVEVVVGEDFRFGHRAAGDVALLRELGERLGFVVDGVDLAGDGERWSSTRVRALLDAGDVEHAADVLGRPYLVRGPVVHGDQRGRAIGYPTANLALPAVTAIPADGVYAGWLTRADGTRLPAAISVGTNPTFDGTQRRVEAYVLDRDDLELYDEVVSVELTHRLRGQVRFDGVPALVEQMSRDVDQARALTVRAS